MSRGRKKRSLRDIVHDDLQNDDFDKIERHLKKGSARSVAILASAQVEAELSLAVLSSLKRIDKGTVSALIGAAEGHGALTTFYQCIHVGFALGLYNEDLRDDMNTVRKIRDVFAHARRPIDFNEPEILEACHKLKSTEYALADVRHAAPRRRPATIARLLFTYTCVSITGRLSHTVARKYQQRQKEVSDILESLGTPEIKN